jgi:hypothetical protein
MSPLLERAKALLREASQEVGEPLGSGEEVSDLRFTEVEARF